MLKVKHLTLFKPKIEKMWEFLPNALCWNIYNQIYGIFMDQIIYIFIFFPTGMLFFTLLQGFFYH